MSSTTEDARMTPQRRAVLQALQASFDHPTAAEVYQRVRARSPQIGAATVYRTLGMLVRTGQALELTLGGQAARYDANTTRHDHVVCQGCGRAIDVDLPVAPSTLGQAATSSGFRVTGYDLQFRGLCPLCASPSGPTHHQHQQGASRA